MDKIEVGDTAAVVFVSGSGQDYAGDALITDLTEVGVTYVIDQLVVMVPWSYCIRITKRRST